jgi:general stress protein YciG
MPSDGSLKAMRRLFLPSFYNFCGKASNHLHYTLFSTRLVTRQAQKLNQQELTMAANNNKSERGFAKMTEKERREIARKGGERVPDEKRSFSQDWELASEAGRKGGESRKLE